MQFAAAALTAVASAGAPAATATAIGTFGSAAATVGSVGAGLSTVGSILQGALSIGGALAAIRAGQSAGDGAITSAYASAAGLDLQAGDAMTEIEIEGINGLDRRNSLRRNLIEVMGERDVAAAASGVDISFGTPAVSRRQATEDTERALSSDKSTEKFRKARLKERASTYRLAARETRRGGLARAAGIRSQANIQAATTIGGTALDLMRRG